LHLAAGAAAVPAVSRIARAQAYPTRPLRCIVGYAAPPPSLPKPRLSGLGLGELRPPAYDVLILPIV